LIKSGITVKEEIFVMKRDMNLIRELLLRVEDSKVELWVSNLEIDGYTDEEIAYNGYLMIDGGLAEGRQTTEHDGEGGKRPVAQTLTNLTWEGHEFFDSIKNESVWKKILGHVQDKGGSAPFNAIAQLAVLFAKQNLGLA